MYKTLDRLFRGDINPFEAPRYHDAELLEAQQLFHMLMDRVQQRLGDNDLFEKLNDAFYDLAYAQERVLFCEGFRLGVRMTAESFIDGGA